LTGESLRFAISYVALAEYDCFSIMLCNLQLMPFDHVAYALPQEIVE